MVAIEVHCRSLATPRIERTEQSPIGGRSFSGRKETEIQIISKFGFLFLVFGLSLAAIIVINRWPNTADDRSHFLSTHAALRNCRHKTCRAHTDNRHVCVIGPVALTSATASLATAYRYASANYLNCFDISFFFGLPQRFIVRLVRTTFTGATSTFTGAADSRIEIALIATCH